MDWDTPPVKRTKVSESAAVDNVKAMDSSSLFRKGATNRGIVIITIITVLALISAFVVRPALIGYSVSEQAGNYNLSVSELGSTVQDLRLELASTKANLSLYTEVYNKIWDEVKTTTDDLSGCQQQKESLQLEIGNVKQQSESELADCEQQVSEAATGVEQQLAEKDQKITEAEEKAADLQENFDEFIVYVARNICCKAKVDNSNINSYEVSNNKLICLESGGRALNC